jgi:hypothetical protein
MRIAFRRMCVVSDLVCIQRYGSCIEIGFRVHRFPSHHLRRWRFADQGIGVHSTAVTDEWSSRRAVAAPH